MKNSIVILALISGFSLAEAQTFKVLKIQGKKAIVEINEADQIELNKTYTAGDSNTASKSGKSSFKRDHGIAAGFTFSNLSVGGASTTLMNLSGEYLWNMKYYEVGPKLSLSNTNVSGGSSTSSTSLGGVGYYNFTDNKLGNDKLWSVYGSLEFGSSSGGASSTTMTLKLGPNYRWFALSGDHGFSISALYDMISTSSSGSNTTTSGLEISGGIVTYF